jgi:hypothetical protein
MTETKEKRPTKKTASSAPVPWYARIPAPKLADDADWQPAALLGLPLSFPGCVEFPNSRPGSVLTLRRIQLPPGQPSLSARDAAERWAEFCEQELLRDLSTADNETRDNVLATLAKAPTPASMPFADFTGLERAKFAHEIVMREHRRKIEKAVAKLRDEFAAIAYARNKSELTDKTQTILDAALLRRQRGARYAVEISAHVVESWRRSAEEKYPDLAVM